MPKQCHLALALLLAIPGHAQKSSSVYDSFPIKNASGQRWTLLGLSTPLRTRSGLQINKYTINMAGVTASNDSAFSYTLNPRQTIQVTFEGAFATDGESWPPGGAPSIRFRLQDWEGKVVDWDISLDRVRTCLPPQDPEALAKVMTQQPASGITITQDLLPKGVAAPAKEVAAPAKERTRPALGSDHR